MNTTKARALMRVIVSATVALCSPSLLFSPRLQEPLSTPLLGTLIVAGLITAVVISLSICRQSWQQWRHSER